MEHIQNRVNSDLRRQFRSFRGFIKKPKKSWSVATLKWFSVCCIGILAGVWAFVLNWTKLELWIGLAAVLGVSMIIVVPVLFVENARAASKGWSRARCCVNSLISVGIAVAFGFAGWIGGTAVLKFVESIKG